jgi:hypothetical protein
MVGHMVRRDHIASADHMAFTDYMAFAGNMVSADHVGESASTQIVRCVSAGRSASTQVRVRRRGQQCEVRVRR